MPDALSWSVIGSCLLLACFVHTLMCGSVGKVEGVSKGFANFLFAVTGLGFLVMLGLGFYYGATAGWLYAIGLFSISWFLLARALGAVFDTVFGRQMFLKMSLIGFPLAALWLWYGVRQMAI